MTLDDDVARLTRTHPFHLLPREAVQLIAFSSEKQSLRAGDTLFCSGEIANSAYFVRSGAILLLEDGAKPEGVRKVGSGALVGETSLYAPVARRTGARAAEDTVVMRISRETFRRVLTEFPAAAGKIRATLAARTHRFINQLEAAYGKSPEPPAVARPRAAP